MPTVILTGAAVYGVKDILKANEMPDGYLKIKVSSGRCTGLAHGMGAEEAPDEDDEVLGYSGLKVLVDKKDASILNGTAIDFKQSLVGGSFQIDDPNAVVSCSCGSSFKTIKAAGNPEGC